MPERETFASSCAAIVGVGRFIPRLRRSLELTSPARPESPHTMRTTDVAGWPPSPGTCDRLPAPAGTRHGRRDRSLIAFTKGRRLFPGWLTNRSHLRERLPGQLRQPGGRPHGGILGGQIRHGFRHGASCLPRVPGPFVRSARSARTATITSLLWSSSPGQAPAAVARRITSITAVSGLPSPAYCEATAKRQAFSMTARSPGVMRRPACSRAARRADWTASSTAPVRPARWSRQAAARQASEQA